MSATLAFSDDWRPPAGPGDYGLPDAQPPGPPAPIDFTAVPLTVAEWEARDLPPPDSAPED